MKRIDWYRVLTVLGTFGLIIAFLWYCITPSGIKARDCVEVMKEGTSIQMEYKMEYAGGSIPAAVDEKLQKYYCPVWAVDNEEIAEISSDGKLTAKGAGEVKVSISYKDFTDEKTILIKPLLQEIKVVDVVLSTINKTGEIKYELIPENAYVEDVEVKIEDETIATYTDGTVNALTVGETKIIVVAEGITAEGILKVKQAAEKLEVNNLSIYAGSGGQLNVKALPANSEIGLKYTYKSNDTSIAKVSDSGWVSGVKTGSTTITVTNEYGLKAESTVKVQGFPLTYSDGTSNITIYKEWYGNAWVYAAHITFSDYSRLGTACGKNVYGGAETTSSAAARQGAILCINGCYSAPYLNYATARSGVVMQDGKCYSPGVYSKHNGLLLSAWEVGGTPGYVGAQLSSLVASGAVTDTFTFGPPILSGGAIKAGSGGGRAQRTFIGTNGAPGDIWLCVSDGRKNDGVSAGLTYTECAQYLQSKGCTLGIPLDGGGSSTMVFRGNVLNAARGNQRAVVDFVYFR